MNEPIRCRGCGHILGIRNADGELEMRHRGRRVVGFRLVECECCGAEWRPAVVVESFLSIRARREAGRPEREHLRRQAAEA
jgi:hypothetical protein